jgi:hypothetical protein
MKTLVLVLSVLLIMGLTDVNAQDLVGRWAMDEGSGPTLIDSSAYGNNGTLFGTPNWVTGVKGLALAFNGSTDCSIIANNASLDISAAITIATWVRPEQYATQDLVKKAINGSTDGYELCLAATSSGWPQRPFVRFNQASLGDSLRLSAKATSTYPINGTWIHLAATYESGVIKLYINGNLDTSRTVPVFTIATNSLPLSIGAQSNNLRWFKGQMDEARVYNYALSASEIQILAQRTCTIVATAGSNGTITPLGIVSVNYGTNKTFSIMADAGYYVSSVLVDGINFGSITSYIFINVITDHTISATFASTSGTLVGHWQMEEGSDTTILDATSNGNNGALFGSPSWIPGINGTALSFDGSNDYGRVLDAPSLDITSGITLAALIKPKVEATQYLIKKALIGVNNGYELSLASPTSSAGAKKVFVRFNEKTSGNTYRLNSSFNYIDFQNNWIHLAATYDGATIRLYLNGIQDVSMPAAFTIGTNDNALGIGAQWNGTVLFNGDIDEVRIYNRPLSPIEISMLAEQALPVQLAFFTALNDANGNILLQWSTITEKNAYGFYMERRVEGENEFSEIVNSFIPAHGTTLEPQNYSFIDNTLSNYGTYHYRLRQVDSDGLVHYSSIVTISVSALSVPEQTPFEFSLDQNYPNPFNPSTVINYQLSIDNYTTLKVYNLIGKEVATLVNGYQTAGYYKVTLDGKNLSSGLYTYKLQSGKNVEVKKMILMK